MLPEFFGWEVWRVWCADVGRVPDTQMTRLEPPAAGGGRLLFPPPASVARGGGVVVECGPVGLRVPSPGQVGVLAEAVAADTGAAGAGFGGGDVGGVRWNVWKLSVEGWGVPGGVWGRRLMFTVTAGPGGQVTGLQGLTLPGRGDSGGVVETWSWIAPEWRGLGFGLAARRAVLAAAFGLFGASRCVSRHVEGNEASAAVSRAAGYSGPLKAGAVGGGSGWMWVHDAESWLCHIAGLSDADRPRLLAGRP